MWVYSHHGMCVEVTGQVTGAGISTMCSGHWTRVTKVTTCTSSSEPSHGPQVKFLKNLHFLLCTISISNIYIRLSYSLRGKYNLESAQHLRRRDDTPEDTTTPELTAQCCIWNGCSPRATVTRGADRTGCCSDCSPQLSSHGAPAESILAGEEA